MLRRIHIAAVFALAVAAFMPLSATAQKDILRSKQVGSVQNTDFSPFADSYSGRYALLLGNITYEDPAYPTLRGVRTDIERMREAFTESGFEVIVDTNLTTDGMYRAVDDFIAEYGWDPDNGLVIYYAGHGTNNNQRGWLVPVDAAAEPSRPDAHRERQQWRRSLVSVSQFYEWTSIAEAKHILFILDGCYSGSLLKTAGSNTEFSTAPRDLMMNRSRYVITSGPWDRQVPDESLFTAALHEMLSGAPPGGTEGYWTGRSLGSRVVQEVSSMQTGRRRKLVPQHGPMPDEERGDLVIPASAFALSRALTDSITRTTVKMCSRVTDDMDTDDALTILELAYDILADDLKSESLGELDRALAWREWETKCLPRIPGDVDNVQAELLEDLLPPAGATAMLPNRSS